MNFNKKKLPAVNLKSGEIYVTDKPSLVVTVLGSCLAVTMFNRRLGVGAICHGFLPQCGKKESHGKTCNERFKYVDCSIQRMLENMREYEIKNSEIIVKLFGGADMFDTKENGLKTSTVGKQNIATALEFLKREGLKVAASDVAGSFGRKIYFHTDTGEILLQRIKKLDKEINPLC